MDPRTIMRRLVTALALINAALVTALPAAQQDGLDAQVEPQTVPQIGGDVQGLIDDFIKLSNITPTSDTSNTPSPGVILGTQNRSTPKPDDCECVPYYLCKEGTIVSSGIGVIDIRGFGPCENYLDVCCKPPDRQEKPTPAPLERVGCGRRNPNGVGFKISGQTDNEAQFGEFPWMVAILKEESIGDNGQTLNVYQCGGSLIHRSAVLTAAHCVNGKEPQELKVRVGEWDTMTQNEILPHQDRNVERVVVHDKFHAGALYNDFAILFLSEPVEYAENVDIVCLPDTNAKFDGSRCFASGWGKDLFGKEGRYQVILKKVELPIVPSETCQDILRTTRLGKYFSLNKSFICAGGETDRDTCKGDGGSPLVCPLPNDPTRYVQAGIVAWGLGCGEDGTPGVYANVADGRRWINEQIAFYNLDNTVYQYTPS